ncbi:MAG: ribosomal L7Ae/L30e/S12e/Gadd45 family protein [Caldicoprobacterales bacterium]|jgi:large subunit ribosomal protein L7A|nr:ribosomal L7Ae/L30e/S12e/Gadd45 family protein [Bacillota bacterium]NLH59440.1 50S ribosomal protein L7Ae-like protein [Clostridiales bacterium]
MLEDLKAAKAKAVGMKQTIKALREKRARLVYLASDVDSHIAENVTEECRLAGVELVKVASMAELGQACGIQVAAATAAILE